MKGIFSETCYYFEKWLVQNSSALAVLQMTLVREVPTIDNMSLYLKIAKPERKTTSTIAATTPSQVERLRGWKSKRKIINHQWELGQRNTQNWPPMCKWSLPEPNQLITFFQVRVLTCPPKQAGSICLEYTTYNHQDLVACKALAHSCSAVACQSLTVQSSTVTSWSSMLSEPTLVRRKGTLTRKKK